MRFDFVPFFNPGENIPWNRVVRMMREQTQIAEQWRFHNCLAYRASLCA